MRKPGLSMLVAMAAVLVATAPAGAAPSEPIRSTGKWFVDAKGRVVIFHGVNIVPPGAGIDPAEAGIGRDDIRFLARQGFRLIRFGTFYADVEPHPGVFDRSHLRDLARYQRKISRAGMFTMLDFHQDLYSPKFKGRGFPRWMVYDDGLPNDPNPGFAAGYFVNPAANRAYDNFWDDHPASDGIGIQAHFDRGWRRTAGLFARRDPPRLLGYEVLNEPWPGSVWPTCANPQGCPPGGFDQTKLTDFTRRAINSIRRGDPRRIAFLEPNLQFDVGADTGLGDPQDPNASLSFHDYCIGAAPGLPGAPDPFGLCAIGEGRVMDNAAAYSGRTGATPLLSEFGDTKDAAVDARVTRLADRRLLSWTVWAYWAANGQIIEDPSKPPTGHNLEQGLLDELVRPYPYVVAGTPKSWSWDRSAGRFRLRYATGLPGAGRAGRRLRTLLIAPRRSFPNGYRVRESGARVISPPNAPVIRLKRLPGANRVRVTVRRRPAE